MELNRRDFLKGTSAVAAATVAAGAFSGAAFADEAVAEPAGYEGLFAESRVILGDIPEDQYIASYDYDLVVIGAGTSGVTAATIAAEKGVGKVAVLQNFGLAISQGNMGSGLIREESDELALQRFKQAWNELYHYSNDQNLIDNYLLYSGDAAMFIAEKAQEGGIPAQNFMMADDIIDYGEDGKVCSRRVFFMDKPVTYAEGMQAIATLGPKMGIDYYYNTPGCKVLQDESGAVIGAVGMSDDGLIRFNAPKVILTCGCFANNQAMLKRYCPDALGFLAKVGDRRGDGHLMAIAAGGHLSNGSYAKMIHDNDAGPMQDVPFLGVNDNGERFMNEDVDSILWNDVVRDQPNKRFTSVWDANFQEIASKAGGRPFSIEQLPAYQPGTPESEAKGVYGNFVATYTADTLEELAEQVGIPAETFVATVERYNEIAASGVDTDFGKKSKWLAPIDTPPFFAAHRWPRLSTILSGVDVDKYMRVLTAEGEVIPGLYAAGNCGGRPASGAGDWLQVSLGESLGFAFTGGYVAGMHAAGAIGE
ncbi:MAG: FAD-binding protein [Coriobacteriales bacterium]|nr:FAD-binding protein [Coriobacteriales bacterium]